MRGTDSRGQRNAANNFPTPPRHSTTLMTRQIFGSYRNFLHKRPVPSEMLPWLRNRSVDNVTYLFEEYNAERKMASHFSSSSFSEKQCNIVGPCVEVVIGVIKSPLHLCLRHSFTSLSARIYTFTKYIFQALLFLIFFYLVIRCTLSNVFSS